MYNVFKTTYEASLGAFYGYDNTSYGYHNPTFEHDNPMLWIPMFEL